MFDCRDWGRLAGLTLVAGLASIAASAPSLANDGRTQRERDMETFRWLDTDGDGEVTRDQAARERSKSFDVLDRNNDGVVTAGEIRAAAAAWGASNPREWTVARQEYWVEGELGTMPGGSIERSAYIEYFMRWWFDRADFDKNGVVTENEVLLMPPPIQLGAPNGGQRPYGTN